MLCCIMEKGTNFVDWAQLSRFRLKTDNIPVSDTLYFK
jgi:hypothetical protein